MHVRGWAANSVKIMKYANRKRIYPRFVRMMREYLVNLIIPLHSSPDSLDGICWEMYKTKSLGEVKIY
jgi:hypothetical protein